MNGASGVELEQLENARLHSGMMARRRERLNALLLRLLREYTPKLRAYATMLLGSVDEADDLVQDTLLKAWRYRASFQAEGNLGAWLFRILRNEYLTQAARPRARQDVNGMLAAKLVASDNAEARLEFSETLRALGALTPLSRDALILMAAGASYDELAEIWGCSLGTVKSRVARARQNLSELMSSRRFTAPRARAAEAAPPAA